MPQDSQSSQIPEERGPEPLAALEAVPDPVIWVDDGGIIRAANGAVRSLGLSPPALLGSPFAQWVDPGQAMRVREWLNQLAAGLLVPLEFGLTPSAHEARWVRACPLPWGQAACYALLLVDLTARTQAIRELSLARDELACRLERALAERRQVEDTLRESEDRWRRLMEHNPACLAVHAGGKVLYANPAGLRLLGATAPEEVVGKPVLSFVHPDYHAVVLDRVRRMMEHDEVVEPLEEKFIRLDGQVIDVEVTAMPITFMGQKAVMTVSWDITRRKKAEEALRASEERYRQFFEMDVAAHYISTPQGYLLACNQAYVAMFGFSSREEAMTTNLEALYPSPEARREFLELVRRQRRVVNHRLELRKRDGSPLYAVVNAVGQFDAQDRLVQIHGFLLDETTRRLLEQQFIRAQRMEALGQIAGGVAHDFKNILGVIVGVADLLLAKSQDDHQLRVQLETIRDAALRSAELARELLELARPRGMHPRLLPVNEALEGFRGILSRLLGEHITVTLSLDPRAGSVRMEPIHLQQVLANLATNAREAVGQRRGEVVITTSREEVGESFPHRPPDAKPGTYVCISFRDNGCGMDPHTASRAFEPFFTTRPSTGTGLGLTTVQTIVTQCGGFVVVESTVGVGTTFKVFLPQAQA